jgi:hypothetical protein
MTSAGCSATVRSSHPRVGDAFRRDRGVNVRRRTRSLSARGTHRSAINARSIRATWSRSASWTGRLRVRSSRSSASTISAASRQGPHAGAWIVAKKAWSSLDGALRVPSARKPLARQQECSANDGFPHLSRGPKFRDFRDTLSTWKGSISVTQTANLQAVCKPSIGLEPMTPSLPWWKVRLRTT